MTNIFIDESGSLTKEYADKVPEFIICLVKVEDIKNLKKIIKKFITENYLLLRNNDPNHKMFLNNTFVELKGSAMSKQIKEKFLDFICSRKLFEVYYINVCNQDLNEVYLKNINRYFNFLIANTLEKNIVQGLLPRDEYLLSIDERNLQIIAHNSLEDYLNIKLQIENNLIDNLNVVYYDSKKELLIQLSDFFSNFYYCYLHQKEQYNELFNSLIRKGIIKNITYY